MTDTVRQCSETKKNGSPCGMPPIKDKDYCISHNPDRGKVATTNSKNATAKGLISTVFGHFEIKDLEDARDLMALSLSHFRQGLITHKDLNSIAYGITQLTSVHRAAREDRVEGLAEQVLLNMKKNNEKK